MIWITIATLISSFTPSAISELGTTLEWKGIEELNPENAYNTLVIDSFTLSSYTKLLRMDECIYTISLSGNLILDSQNPTTIDIITRNGVNNSILHVTTLELSQKFFVEGKTFYFQYDLRELTDLSLWSPYYPDIYFDSIKFDVSIDTFLRGDISSQYMLYSQSINIPTYTSYSIPYNNGFNDGTKSGYSNGYNLGFEQGKASVTCTGPEQQSVFDLLKSAFNAPLALFNIQLMPGLTLGTLLLLPVAIAVLFAIWRLLT